MVRHSPTYLFQAYFQFEMDFPTQVQFQNEQEVVFGHLNQS